MISQDLFFRKFNVFDQFAELEKIPRKIGLR